MLFWFVSDALFHYYITIIRIISKLETAFGSVLIAENLPISRTGTVAHPPQGISEYTNQEHQGLNQ
jgi:hypothetical protein